MLTQESRLPRLVIKGSRERRSQRENCCTADPELVDAKTRSKWSRALRYAAVAMPARMSLANSLRGSGGLNEAV